MKIQTLKSYLVPSSLPEPTVRINGLLLGPEAIQVEHWHQSAATQIVATIEIDTKKTLADIGLGEDASLGGYVTAFSRLTKIKSVSQIFNIDSGNVEIVLDVSERSSGGYLLLEVVIICQDQGLSAQPLSPNTFDVLATWNYVAELEGDSPRANVQLVNFEGVKEKALWEIVSFPPEELEDWKFASISSVIQVNLSADAYLKLKSDSVYQIQYCVDFMWEAIVLATYSEEILTSVFRDSENSPGSLIRTCAEIIKSVFGHQEPTHSDVVHFVQTKPSHVRAILQDRAARMLRIKI